MQGVLAPLPPWKEADLTRPVYTSTHSPSLAVLSFYYYYYFGGHLTEIIGTYRKVSKITPSSWVPIVHIHHFSHLPDLLYHSLIHISVFLFFCTI